MTILKFWKNWLFSCIFLKFKLFFNNSESIVYKNYKKNFYEEILININIYINK